MESLIAVIVGLVGLVGFLFTKLQNSQALNSNLATKEEVDKLSTQQGNNKAHLITEEEKRQLLEDSVVQIPKDIDEESLNKYLNDLLPPSK